MVLLYYNKDMFGKAGSHHRVTDPMKGWTWDQAIEAWGKVTRP